MAPPSKHDLFVNSTMKDKDVDAIAGISADSAVVLRAKGYSKAWQMLGRYLLCGDDMFCNWLTQQVGEGLMSDHDRSEVCRCLREWYAKHPF